MTSCITTIGCTWMGESWTTLYGRVVGPQHAAQSAIWYSTPSGAVWRRFMAILAAEWRGVLNSSWNSERPLIFIHVVLTKKLGVLRSQEIKARIMRRMKIWETGVHAGLMGGSKAEGPPGRARPPPEARRRTSPWPGVITT